MVVIVSIMMVIVFVGYKDCDCCFNDDNDDDGIDDDDDEVGISDGRNMH